MLGICAAVARFALRKCFGGPMGLALYARSFGWLIYANYLLDAIMMYRNLEKKAINEN